MKLVRRARITTLHAVAKTRREGFLEACYKSGRVTSDGLWIIWDDDTHAQLRRQFNPNPPSPISGRARRRRTLTSGLSFRPAIRRFISIPFVDESLTRVGLGDLIHKFAGPVGRAIHWPCMKGNGSTDLKPGSPCAKARELANRVKF
jgi:hypothetical protein